MRRIVMLLGPWWLLMARLLAQAVEADPQILQDISDDEVRVEFKAWLETLPSTRAYLGESLRRIPSALLRLAPLWLIAAAYVGGAAWAPKTAGHDYFVAAAGVIPVLLLALAIETRILRFRWLARFEPAPLWPKHVYDIFENSTDADVVRWALRLRKADATVAWLRAGYRVLRVVGLAVLVLVLLSLSEWHCMNTLASIGDHTREPAIVSSGILAGLAGVCVVALVGGTEVQWLAALSSGCEVRNSRRRHVGRYAAPHPPARNDWRFAKALAAPRGAERRNTSSALCSVSLELPHRMTVSARGSARGRAARCTSAFRAATKRRAIPPRRVRTLSTQFRPTGGHS